MTQPTFTHPVVTPYSHEAAYDAGHLKVGSIHEIYYEQYGKKDGLPVIFLHGGPGGSTSPANAKYFNPAVYRVVLLDQRGVGKSRPRNELKENTTQHLSDDIERLREHLSITKWHLVFGGSWGSTLGLYYAQAYPDKVGSLVLRGVFTARRSELWAESKIPASALFFPEEWEAFVNFLPENERADLWNAYYARITSGDREVALPAARAWNAWGFSQGSLKPDPGALAEIDEDDEFSLTHALFESHYLFKNNAWLEDGQLLFPANLEKIKDIPGAIIQGRHDTLCPPVTAWELHKGWRKSTLQFVYDSAHSANEPGTTAYLIQACDELAKL
ncbi:prolyl aminopeptidase [Xylaria arbuscula]|nr:prolyl aminopeptidase [Xylaria arbuscula]